MFGIRIDALVVEHALAHALQGYSVLQVEKSRNLGTTASSSETVTSLPENNAKRVSRKDW